MWGGACFAFPRQPTTSPMQTISSAALIEQITSEALEQYAALGIMVVDAAFAKELEAELGRTRLALAARLDRQADTLCHHGANHHANEVAEIAKQLRDLTQPTPAKVTT